MGNSLNTGKRSFSAWVICIVILFSSVWISPRIFNPGAEAVLGWDVFGYYVYLPAIFIYHDVTDMEFLPALLDEYQPAPNSAYASPVENGNYVMKYSMGQAVFYTPFFFLSHLYAKISSYKADGVSFPYQVGIFLGSLFYSFLGLWLVRNILLRYFTDGAVAASMILLVLGTNYLNYVSFDGAMTHNHLFTLYAALLYLTIKWHEKQTLLRALGIGLLCGLAALTRPTEMISILIPVLWGVTGWESAKSKVHLFWEKKSHVLLVIVGAIFVGSWQLIYWKYVSGHWLVYSYRDEGFSFLSPYIINGLFSFRKGWLIYTPMMGFAIVGLYYLYKQQREIFLAVLIFSLLNMYITFSWDIWWYGGSYGQRAMVQSYAVWMIPFAAFWQAIWHRKWLRPVLGVLVVAFIYMNLLLTYYCHSPGGYMPADQITMKYYYEVFVKWNKDPEMKKYLDNKWELPNESRFDEVITLGHMLPDTTFENIALDTVEGIPTWRLDNKHQELRWEYPVPEANKESWASGEITYFFYHQEWDMWRMARMRIALLDETDRVLYTKDIRLHWLTHENNWHTTTIDIPLFMYNGNDNRLVLTVDDPGNAIYVSDMKLRLYNKQ